MTRSVHADVATRLKTVVAPNADTYMDAQKAIGAMPLAKLHSVYEELFGDKPEVIVDDNVVLSPNRKQLVRLCQYGYQSAFYGESLPPQVVKPTQEAFAEELVAESAKARTQVARGPTIKELVLELLAGHEGQYVDPTDGQTKTGMIVPADEEIYKAVKASFPESKFDRTHLAWYLTQYRKGRFMKDGYGGETGKPMGILTRNIVRAEAKAKREAENAVKDAARAEKKAKAPKEVTLPAAGGAPSADPLAEFGDTPAIADPSNP